MAERRFSRSRPPINDRKCEIEGCGKTARSNGICNMHYMRVKRHGDPHYSNPRYATRATEVEPICRAEGCTKARTGGARGLCQGHYIRLKKYGEEGVGGPLGRQNIGNAQRNVLGYMVRRDWSSPLAGKKTGNVLIHREVMSKKLGRLLLPGENVHHINGNRADNRPENLELFITLHPSGQRPEDLVMWAENIIKLYGCSSIA